MSPATCFFLYLRDSATRLQQQSVINVPRRDIKLRAEWHCLGWKTDLGLLSRDWTNYCTTVVQQLLAISHTWMSRLSLFLTFTRQLSASQGSESGHCTAISCSCKSNQLQSHLSYQSPTLDSRFSHQDTLRTCGFVISVSRSFDMSYCNMGTLCPSALGSPVGFWPSCDNEGSYQRT